MGEKRTEADFLGEKKIDNDAYYGIQTLRAVENFPITGHAINFELIRAISMVKYAAAIANYETGRLSKDFKTAICEASQEIVHGKWHNQFIVDPIQGGAGTSLNMNANEVIANLALEKLGKQKGEYSYLSPNTHVNMSQSTNDAFPTAIRISVINRVERLLVTMDNMLESFKDKSIEFDPIIKMGRTHLQDAVPIRLGQEFEAYYKVISRDISRIKQSLNNIFEINMGATAVGTGLNADKEYIKKTIIELKNISSLDLVEPDNLVDATQNTDAYTEVSGALKVCMMNMSKIANDLRMMSSGPRTGLNEINLPPRQPGSSIMPGKVNPVMAELINQIAFQVIGNDNTICLASEGGQFELNVMEPVLVHNLLESIKIMDNGFEVFTKYCIDGITANEDILKEYVENSVGILTAITPHIGYERATLIAIEAINTGQSVRELCEKYKLFNKTELNNLFDIYQLTKSGVTKISTPNNK